MITSTDIHSNILQQLKEDDTKLACCQSAADPTFIANMPSLKHLLKKYKIAVEEQFTISNEYFPLYSVLTIHADRLGALGINVSVISSELDRLIQLLSVDQQSPIEAIRIIPEVGKKLKDVLFILTRVMESLPTPWLLCLEKLTSTQRTSHFLG